VRINERLGQQVAVVPVELLFSRGRKAMKQNGSEKKVHSEKERVHELSLRADKIGVKQET
jgi:hypothetical protein